MLHTRLVPLGVVALIALAAACGDDDAPGLTATPGTGPTEATMPATTVPGSTAQPTESPAATFEATSPRVEYMTIDHGGTGLVVIRVYTDVETTAVLRAVGPPGQVSQSPADQSSDEPATLHTFSMPTFMQDWTYEVQVTAGGRQASGTLESGEIVGTQYWGRAEQAPTVELDGLDATVIWTSLRDGTGQDVVPGQVVVLSKPEGCTTAEQCVGELVDVFAGDLTGGDAVAETHAVESSFPDDGHDYQVVIAGRPGTADVRFFQLDVLAADLE